MLQPVHAGIIWGRDLLFSDLATTVGMNHAPVPRGPGDVLGLGPMDQPKYQYVGELNYLVGFPNEPQIELPDEFYRVRIPPVGMKVLDRVIE